MTENAIIIQDDVVQNTALSVLPTMNETAVSAINRSLAIYKAINTLVEMTFIRGVDYDDVTGKKEGDKDYKPTLLLPGIEKVMGLLGLTETFKDIHVERNFDPGAPFFFYEVECVLTSVVTGQVVARGQGVCHTREKAFMRQSSRICPNCEKPALMRSKFPPKDNPKAPPGWYCNAKADGCGANFDAADRRITGQETGNVVDVQLVWDGINRARKIANKRAKAEAVKRIGMLSSRFTVDLEDDMRYSDADLNPTTPPAGNIITGNFAPQTATEQPPSSTQPPTPEPHWSADPAKIKALVDFALSNHFIEAGQGNADLLKIVGVRDWSVYMNGQDAGRAIKNAAEALKKPAETPFSQFNNGTSSSRHIRYDGSKIYFKLEAGSATWFKGRGALDKLLNIAAFKFADIVEGDHDLPFAMQVDWQAKKGQNGDYREVTNVTADQNNIDAWLAASKPAPQPEAETVLAGPPDDYDDIPF